MSGLDAAAYAKAQAAQALAQSVESSSPLDPSQAPYFALPNLGDVSAAVQACFDDAEELRRPVRFGAGDFMFAARVTAPSGVKVSGAGRGVTVLKSMPGFATNGPIITNATDAVTGDNIPVRDLILEDLTIDGDYASNTAFNATATLTVAALFVTSGTPEPDGDIPLASMTFDDTSELTSSGRILFETYTGDNVGLIEYTGKTPTTLTGCTFISQSNSTPIDVAAPRVFRQFNVSTAGLVRFYVYERLTINRVHIKDGGSYCLGLQGSPEEFDTSPDKVYPKNNLLIVSSAFSGSYNSDGIDIKEQYGVTMIDVEAYDNHDKGINVRGRYQTYVNCRTWGNGNGFGLSCIRLEYPEPYVTLTAICTAADTTLTVTDTANMSAAASGYLGAERIAWTGKTATTLTGVTRGLQGTKATPHNASSDTAYVPIVQDVAGGEEVDASIDMLGCWSLGDGGNGIAITTGGSGVKTRATVHGGGAFGCNRGLLLQSTRGQMDVSVHGGNYHHNGEGIRLVSLAYARLTGVNASDNTTASNPNGTGHGVSLVNCTNGAELVAMDVCRNGAYGLSFASNGTSDYVKVRGGRWRANTLGAVNNPPQTIRHNVGQLFAAGVLSGLGVPTNAVFVYSQTAALTANQGRFIRYVAPHDYTISQIAFVLRVASGANDAVDVGIYNASYQLLASSGAVLGVLNGATGVKNVPLTASVELMEGGIYYVGMSAGAIGGTAPTVKMTLTDADVADILGGGTGNRAQLAMSAAHPLPATLSAVASTSAAPIMALKA